MNNPLMETYNNCRICDNPLKKTLIRFESLPVAGSYVTENQSGEDLLLPLTLMRCSDCGFVQLNESLLPEFYNSYRFVSGISTGYQDHLSEITRRIKSVLPEQSTILEIGASDGTLLAMLREQNMRVAGYEPANEPAQVAVSKGLDVINDFFSQQTVAICPVNQVDLIIIRHVYEHLNHFEEIFAALEQLIHKKTLLLLEVPDLAATIENKIYGNIYHAHSGYFDIKTLTFLLEKYGWHINAAGLVNIFGGSLLTVAARTKEPLKNSEQLVFGTPVSALNDDALASFINEWQNSISRIREFFNQIKRDGLQLAGYGAGERTTAIIGAADLGKEIIECLYDRNPALQGLSLPGSRIKIKAPEKLLRDKPDALVIFAQSFEEEIVSELDAYRQNGGRFISMRTVPPSFIQG